jgi:hypothetical protein
MHIHIMRRHSGKSAESASKSGSWSIPNSQQPSFFPNYVESHAYEKMTHHPNSLTDEIKKTEIFQDTILGGLRRISEMKRLMNELARNSGPPSILNETTKLSMIQMVSDSFQGTRTMPTKGEILPSGYQLLFCNACLSGCKLRQVLYPIEFEAVTKLVHVCDSKNFLIDQNQKQNKEETLEKKRQIKVSLENGLLQIVSRRIGQRDAYLKARKLSQNAFSEETRSEWKKLLPNISLIDERDCIKFDPPRDMANIDHWFHRTIREYDNDSNVKVTHNELSEFLRIAKATFGIFQIDTNDPDKKYYFLIYLVL